MTQNKRIIVNVLATYGRSLFSLFCGLCTSRWLLQSLGKEGLGLFGVVGGLSMFVTMLNDIMAGSVSRFYAVAVGEAKRVDRSVDGLEDCRKWFNCALSIHTVLPLLLIAVGFPCGEWAVRHFLNIPTDKVLACVWVWRFTCITCFVSMVNVPFRAMYSAKQEIAELTVYSICQTAANFCFICYMASHPQEWLAKYAAWACFVSVVPQLLICIRACVVYPECHLNGKYLFDAKRIVELGKFAALKFWGTFSALLSGQGEAILINKSYSAACNAAKGISGQVVAHISTLAGALNGAFAPAIMNAAGEGDSAKAKTLSVCTCKIGTMLLLLFVIPAAIEIDTLLELWLGDPPRWTAGFCLCALAGAVCEQMTEGYSQLIYADGRIAGYQFWIGNACFIHLGLSVLFLALGLGPLSVGYAFVLAKIVIVIDRLYYVRKLSGIGYGESMRKVIIPLLALMAVVSAVAFLPRCFLRTGFMRVCMTTIVAEVLFLPLSWFVLLGEKERGFLEQRCQVFWKKMRK